MSRSWVTLHRAADPDFRWEIEKAVDEAKAALRRARDERNGNAPPSGWGFLDGEELVVRGTGGAGGGKRVQIARARLKQWSPRVETRFLATLAATCNVKAACAEVGMTAASAYNHRKRWAGFARLWDAAVEEGFVRLELRLLECANNFLSDEALPDAAPLTGMSVEHAKHVLHMHKHRVHGLGKRPGRRRERHSDPDGLHEFVLRCIDALKRADPDQLARDREEWARRRGS